MHVQTDTVILSFSVSLVPVSVAGRETSTGPTGKEIKGIGAVEATCSSCAGFSRI